MRGSVIAALGAVSLVLAGCASSSEDVVPAYVSPYAYQSYTCPQLADEMQRITIRVHQVAGGVDHAATDDKIAMGVGIVLFWPALLMVKGDGAQHQELARLKGEYDAVNEAMIRHNCNSPDAGMIANAAAGGNSSGATSGTADSQPTYSSYNDWKTAGATQRKQAAKTHGSATISGAVN